MPVMTEEYMIRETPAPYEDRGDNVESEQTPEDRGDNVEGEQKPAEEKPAEEKPAEEKPAEEKPAEEKPAEGEEKPAEGEQKPAEGDDDKQQPGPGWVPRHRYNAQARRARELEAKLQEMEGGQQTPPASDQGQQPAAQPTGSESVHQQLTEVNGKITQAIRDGSAEGLDDLYKQQLDLQTQYAQEVAREAAQTTTRSTNDETAYDRRVSEIEHDYPVLNPDNTDVYDDSLAARVETLRDAFVAKGYSMTEAIDEALTTLEPLLTPAQAAAADTAGKSDERTQEALRRNAEAAGQQPAPADGGSASDKHGHTPAGPNVADMTEEEFDALPEEEA